MMNGGSAALIDCACASVTARALGAWNTSPTASAPACAAALASAVEHRPQILVRTRFMGDSLTCMAISLLLQANRTPGDSASAADASRAREIGRASCRERG